MNKPDRNSKPAFSGERVRLGDVCAKGKSSLRQKDLRNDGPYVVFGASGIAGTSASYQNESPYVAVVKDGAGVGRARICQEQSSVLGTMQALIPNERITCKYLLHLVQSMKLGEGFSGSTIPHIYFKDYSEREVIVPALDDQEKITSTLDKIENLINGKKTTITHLQTLVKSRFVEMFGDVFGRPEGIGEAELQDIAEVGSSKRVFKDELLEDGVPFYRGTEISALSRDGRVTPSLFISKEHYKRLIAASGKPEVGDLLLPSICPDGQIWCVNTSEPFYFKDGRVLWVRPDRKIVNSVFLRYALGIQFVDNFEQVASGTTFAEMKIFLLKAMKVPIAPMELQEQFAAFVRQVDKLEFVAQQQIEKLQTLYDSLAQEYFG